jgi:hypothetical protein
LAGTGKLLAKISLTVSFTPALDVITVWMSLKNECEIIIGPIGAIPAR